jgi:hypothetical protein
MFTGVGRLITGLVSVAASSIMGIFNVVLSFVKGFIDGMVGFFIDLYNRLVGHSIIPDMMSAIYDTIVTWLTDSVDWVKTQIDNLVAWFDGLDEVFEDIGKNMLNGLWNGLKAKWDSIKKWWQGKIGSLGGTAEDELEIDSPSQVMYRIGEMAAEGLKLGFGSAVGDLLGNATARLSGLGAGGGQQIFVIQIPSLSLPGIQDGRDAGNLVEQLLQESADQAGLRGLVPGGIMP